MLLVQCPNCKQRMKTDPKNPAKSSKRCVFCGKSFKLVTEDGNRIIAKS